MTAIVNTDRLAALAARINKAHHSTRRQALVAGRDLIEAKRIVGHGNFEAWVARECDFSMRTARAYMCYARKAANSADSIDGVLLANRRERFRLRRQSAAGSSVEPTPFVPTSVSIVADMRVTLRTMPQEFVEGSQEEILALIDEAYAALQRAGCAHD